MRLLFADRHTMLRDGLRPLLQELDRDVDLREAASHQELIEALASARMDLALVDWSLFGRDAEINLENICLQWPSVPIVVLSNDPDKVQAGKALRSGASGFISKTMSARVLFSALRLVIAGERYIPSHLLVGDGSPTGEVEQKHNGEGPNRAPALTERERDILLLLRDGLPNKLIARQLRISEITVKSHLSNVFRKLGVQNRVQAARIPIEPNIPWLVPVPPPNDGVVTPIKPHKKIATIY